MRSFTHILFGLLVLLIPTACKPSDLIEDPGWEYMADLNYSASSGMFGGTGSIRQWTPVNLVITVSDKEGRELLSPEREGNYFEGATLRFMGTTYAAQDESALPKAYQPDIYGYFLIRQDTRYCLLFGEIDGAADLDEDIVLRWRDGSTDTIHYHCARHDQKKMTCERSWELNGQRVSGNVFSLVK